MAPNMFWKVWHGLVRYLLFENEIAIFWGGVCVCCTICKATDAQFAVPQTHILQSNSSVQSAAETSCLPCSVAVALTAIGLTTIGLDACSVALQFNH